MTSKTHVALGILTALVIHRYYPHIHTYDLVSGVAIGSLIPDLDIKKSDPSQIFPPISMIVDKFTKHRGFTHTILPALFIIAYFVFKNDTCLFIGIGGLTHLISDVVTLKIGITCKSKGQEILYISFWIGIGCVILWDIWMDYNLIQYVPNEIKIKILNLWRSIK